MGNICKERLMNHIEKILSSEPEDYSTYSSEEIFALSIAILSHRRLIKTHNFNLLTREFTHRLQTFGEPEAYQVSCRMEVYHEILEDKAFNFQHSEVQIQMSDETLQELLDRSKAARILHPKVQEFIQRTSRSLAAKISRECQNTPMSADDIAQDLLVYLLENAEKNYDPSKSAYTTYAYTTLRFRSKFLMSLLRSRNSKERLSVFQNDSEQNTYDEHLQGSNLTKLFSNQSALDSQETESVSRQYEVLSTLQELFSAFTPLEQSVLFLQNQLSCNASSLPFQLGDILKIAESRGRESLHA